MSVVCARVEFQLLSLVHTGCTHMYGQQCSLFLSCFHKLTECFLVFLKNNNEFFSLLPVIGSDGEQLFFDKTFVTALFPIELLMLGFFWSHSFIHSFIPIFFFKAV